MFTRVLFRSSLTLNPTSVVGGVQSSTGTVTLSGPAPAGGAQVMLSSSNGAASVSSSVTVPAGSSSANFTISTSARSEERRVGKEGTYGCASTSASIKVMPPPLPTVPTLPLFRRGLFGGVQSSTGTVTLSGPAPAGGAQVMLSSSNGAASVSSSVTVPAGSSSANFTISTSA